MTRTIESEGLCGFPRFWEIITSRNLELGHMLYTLNDEIISLLLPFESRFSLEIQDARSPTHKFRVPLCVEPQLSLLGGTFCQTSI